MNTVTVFITFALLMSVVKTATETVNCFNKDSDSNTNKRIYTIAHGNDWGGYDYVDDGGYFTGFAVELVREVCAEAGIDCRTVWDPYTNCVKSETGQHLRAGQGLMDRWYDACTGWFVTVTRQSFAKFSQSFLKSYKAAFFAKSSGSSFDVNKWWDYKIAFIDGWADDEKCLARNLKKVLPRTQIFHYATRTHVKDAIVNGEVDAGHVGEDLMEEYITGNNPPLKKIGQDHTCVVRGGAMMSRKDSDFPAKWNEGFAKLVSSGRFQKLCAEAKKTHGIGRGGIDCV